MASPVHSTHPEMQLESIDSQADFGLRTADFFDDSTSEEEAAGILEDERQDVDLLNHDRQGSPTPKRRSKPLPAEPVTQCENRGPSLQPEGEGYLRLSPVRSNRVNRESFVDTPSSSFNGSVDELLPGEQASSPPSMLRAARLSALRRPRDSTILPRSEPAIRSSSVIPTPEPRKVDNVLAHTIAHEITLAALLRDGTTLNQVAHTFNPADRSSLLPASLRIQAPDTGTDDPRSPGTARKFSTPAASQTGTIDTSAAAVANSSKKVQVLPPPIDTTVPPHHLPPHLVRTPYPTSSTIRNTNRQKHFSHQPTPSELHKTPTTPNYPSETLLTLSIRRRTPSSHARVTTLLIPSPDPPLPDDAKTRHFPPPKPFDDTAFFHGLRTSYAHLTGPYRYISARTIQRITVCGTSSLAADKGYGWLHQPRSPRELAQKGLSDTFGEDKIFALFRRPRLGKDRYAFVWWGRRLAAAEAEGAAFLRAEGFAMGDRSGAGMPGLGSGERANDLVRRLEQPEGLEFVLGWSWKRILAALALVLVLSLAAMLLWIFLGKNSEVLNSSLRGGGVATASGAGFKGAGDRVAAGAVVGICVLALGTSGFVGWLGMSWLVM